MFYHMHHSSREIIKSAQNVCALHTADIKLSFDTLAFIENSSDMSNIKQFRAHPGGDIRDPSGTHRVSHRT